VRLKPIMAVAFACALLGGIHPTFAQTQTAPAPGATPPGTAQTPAGQMRPSMSSTPNAAMQKGAPVNINTASAADLDSLPQIGPKRAAKIIANRPYKTIDDLLTKKAIPKSVFEKIKSRITT
jgi:competence protein ComEA